MVEIRLKLDLSFLVQATSATNLATAVVDCWGLLGKDLRPLGLPLRTLCLPLRPLRETRNLEPLFDQNLFPH